ncbi:insulin-like receptor-like [Calliopsis andreniformis]|uniref:insulin-like receptor-like n=1 Tax=Calliopsis andreniformis TaxID=337506 RepID=UPI003FCE90A7
MTSSGTVGCQRLGHRISNHFADTLRWTSWRSTGFCWLRQRYTLLWMFLFLSVLVFPALTEPQKGTSRNSSKEDGVCQSVDIRNNVSYFASLRGCRMVEGFVQILLIDNAEPSDFDNITFPELKEITGYLMLYRVRGLRSIGRLFPNLTVIRGNSLFINYALVTFEMLNLQEIGLHSLTTIVRGSVRFEKNPALCFVDTIDWDLIAKSGKGENVIVRNKPRNGCPVCEKHCPRRQTNVYETLCWNQQHCQQICDRKCENNACDENGNCCHSSCLGTCTGPTSRDCSVCKDVATIDNDCREHCPNGTFRFMNHRCIDEDRCLQMPKPKEAHKTSSYPYKPFNGTCVMECPPGYMDDEKSDKPACKKCEGLCQKECPGASVDNIATAQTLRGCTHIKGSLEIQIRGGKNIVKELEDNLSTIEEINGYLKVARSFPLISLNFLQNLRVIRGNDTENTKYALMVMDNQNLQELWDWSWHKDIKILSKGVEPGKIFFHLNPKLCLYKIETLREKAGLAPFTHYEVAPNSNGDKMACNVTELWTSVGYMAPWGAVIEWEPFVHHDPRSLLGYVVYFIEAPNKNLTMYDGRDACGGDRWKVEDVPPNTNTSLEHSRRVHTYFLSQLKAYTQYAYYVKTYTIATENFGAQSKLTYFRTPPDAPTSPRSLDTWSNSSSELIMSWQPPLHKNGNLTHYRILGRWEPDDPSYINQRNYCEKPLLLSDTKAIMQEEEERKQMEKEKEKEKEQNMKQDAGTCVCTDRETDQSLREKEVTSAIAFEDALHNQVYVKRKTRKKREAEGMSMAAAAIQAKASAELDEPIQDKIINNTYVVFERRVPSTNLSFAMKNLRHFTAYNIEVQACRAPEMNDAQNKCSSKSMRMYRTLPLQNADNIPPHSFKMNMSGENNSMTLITLQWDEPPHPNGLILTYQIEYKRVDIQNHNPYAATACITRTDFIKAGKSYVINDLLQPGNYSVKVRASSLAGYGAYTPAKYFYIKERNSLSTFWVTFWLLLCALFVLFLFGSFFVYKQKFLNGPNGTLIATVNPEYVSTPYVLDEWEVPREKIEMLRPLGNGTFGMVYDGIARDIVPEKPEVRCAVKTVNKDATDRERIEFLNEASVMKGFDAHHVVKLLGVVTRGQPTLVIMELMVNGDLKRYLRSHRPCENFSNTPPKLERILQMAIEIADGMAYLSTKKFVHRDLAARNCMVAEDLTVKVGDFGMTRDVYERDYYRKGSKGLLPVRWMAPESLKDGVFSSFSDVWSYGVVLWEMVTFASQPYQGLSNDQVLRYVIDGGVMERPENCPEMLYELMKQTWRHQATRRPTFMDIASMLLKHIDPENFKKVSFYHSQEGIEARYQNRSTSPQTDGHLDMSTLRDVQEEETEGDEDSPLRQDFDNFASFEPSSPKNSFSPRYKMDPCATANRHDASCDSIGTLNLHVVENSLKSVKSSPFINAKSTSRSNLSQLSMGNKSLSPKNPSKRSFLSSPNSAKLTVPDYENGSPEILSTAEKRETVPLRVDFPSMDAIDIDNGIGDSISTVDYVNKPETLNNGYISGATT